MTFDPEATDLRFRREPDEEANTRLLYLDRFDTSDVSERPSFLSSWGGRSLTPATTTEGER